MKFSFKFSNLCGTVYAQGNLAFTPNGGSLVSPVGNRVTVFDLENSKSVTLPTENRKNIACIALSPDASVLITVDEEGHALLINFKRGVVLNHFNFKKAVLAIVFSPDGKYFAVTHENQIQVWGTPTLQREFAPFVLHRTYTGHYDEALSIDWASDSQTFITGSRDLTSRIYSLDKTPGYPVILGGHREPVIAAFLADDGRAYTVSRDGALFVWRDTGAEEAGEFQVGEKRPLTSGPKGPRSWRREARHLFKQSKVVCAALHKRSGLLVAGFASGIFGLYELPDFVNVHTLSISSQKITTVSINSTGEWLAFGSRHLGQLLVWEWQSETYVLKQQGHAYGMNALDYSPNGALLATAGEDGKVKLWNTDSGFCFVTFADHAAPATAVRFSPAGNAVVSASLDGTVRAFDLTRYRNFRTLTTPSPAQFASLALDPTGDLVCAGAQDTFEIFLWSLRTGRLLEVLSGHEGPVSGLAFSPVDGALASCSWDRTVKLWDVLETRAATLSLPHATELLCLAVRPDGRELVASTMDGHLVFWNAADGAPLGSIECRRDAAGGRRAADRTSQAAQAAASFFTTVCYSADGRCVLAGGNSKWLCIYHVARRACIKKFPVSANRSLDGVAERLHSGRMTAAGPLDDVDHDPAAERGDAADRRDESLPGAARGAAAARRRRPPAATRCARFSPTGRAWAAATTEGLLVFSLDTVSDFDPLDLVRPTARA
jgi:periodic tryptophan protein 2